MTVVAVVVITVAILVWIVKDGLTSPAGQDASEFDPGYDKHVRDLLDEP
jgi:hypothetical protein